MCLSFQALSAKASNLRLGRSSDLLPPGHAFPCVRICTVAIWIVYDRGYKKGAYSSGTVQDSHLIPFSHIAKRPFACEPNRVQRYKLFFNYKEKSERKIERNTLYSVVLADYYIEKSTIIRFYKSVYSRITKKTSCQIRYISKMFL